MPVTTSQQETRYTVRQAGTQAVGRNTANLKDCQPDSVLVQMPSFAAVRISLLLVILLFVVIVSTHQKVYSRNWNQTLKVTVFPINGDGQPSTARYIDKLTDADFAQINRWGEREAKRHDLDLPTPFNVVLGDTIQAVPPSLSEKANPIDTLLWGLRFRYWAWRNTPDSGSLTRVRMFVVYVQGSKKKALQHSLGLQKGLMGLVYAFSDDRQTAQNNIVIAHELLHTVGASDKYSPYGNPQFPIGYAYPQRTPRHPQRSAEIMAGRIPITANSSYMAETLRSVIVNKYTAREINWINIAQ